MCRTIIVLVLVGLCVHTASALPGSGTQQDPYRIESLADFDEFAADPNYWSGFTRLETDVNLAGRTYSTAVIAPDVNNANYDFDGTAFTGVFDGNDHKILNLTIDGGAGNEYLGLFGYIGEDGEVRNLGLKGGSVSGSGSYWCENVGGLVGWNDGTISNCYSTGSVSGDAGVGGLVGLNSYWAVVSNCYSAGDVNGVGYVGGLVGENWFGTISDSYSTGSVNGGGYVGGLVGLSRGTISNCYSTGDVNGVDVGGLVGVNTGSISNCYSIGDVNGVEGVGGLVGWNSYWAVVSNCYSTGAVSGNSYVGGLVGGNGSCTPYVGCESGYIFNSYSTGSVQGASDVGGLVGYNFVGDIEGSFWDVETSGEPNMCGDQSWSGAGCDPNCGKTTSEMQTRSTFIAAGWDFIEIWGIGEGQTYPYLKFAPAGDLNYDKKVDLVDFAILASHWLEGKDN